jgi:hypothetical protein
MYLPAERPNFDELYEEVVTVVKTGELRTPLSNFPALQAAFQNVLTDSESYPSESDASSAFGGSSLSMGNDGYMADTQLRIGNDGYMADSLAGGDNDGAGSAQDEAPPRPSKPLDFTVPSEEAPARPPKSQAQSNAGGGRRQLPQHVNTAYVKEPLRPVR